MTWRRQRAALLVVLGLTSAAKKRPSRGDDGGQTMVLKGDGLRAREDGMKAADEGRFADAVPLLQKAAKSHPKRTTKESLSAASTDNALGGALKALGRPKDAMAAFERAMKILDGIGEDGHRDLAVVVNNLGAVRADVGRVAEAEELYRHALKIAATLGTSSAFEDDDDDEEDDDDASNPKSRSSVQASAYNNLADLRHDAGRLDEAKALHERALSIRERVLGPNHGDIAGSLNNVAVLLMDLKQYEEALPRLQRAADILKDTAGSTHPQHATSLVNLANALTLLKRPVEARGHLKRALSINKKALGEEHETTKEVAKQLETAMSAVEAKRKKRKR